jgi:hypothetical protein
MKKQLYFIILLLICINPAQAQQQWQWGKSAQNQTREIAVDKNGNTYVLWAIGSQASVDGHPIASNGSTDIGISSFRCDGTYRWTKVIGTTSPDSGFGLATDTLGGLYILAHLGSGNTSSIYIDDDATLPPTMKKMMLLKYDTTGNFLWQRTPEADNIVTVTSTAGFNLTVEKNGTAHILCVLEAGVYGNGAFTATHSNDENIHALKYDKNGNFLGGLHFDVNRPAAAGISSYGFHMMYDPVSTHYYWNGIRYDPYSISFGGTSITGGNFFTCFSNTGNVLWVQKSNNNLIPTALTGRPTVDPSGNIYVTGYSYNDFNGGAGDGFGTYDFNNTYGPWAFPILVKFNSSGTVLYATNASGNTDNAARYVVYSNDTVALAGEYAGGNFEWDGISLGVNNQYYNDFVAKFDAATGNIIRIDTLYSGAGVDEYVTALATDHRGNFYLGGEFNGNITIAGTTYTKQDGFTDGYIAKLGFPDCSNCTTPSTAFTYTGTEPVYNFTYTGSANADSVVWSLGDGHSVTGLNFQHSYTSAGTYTVCATAYNSCGQDQFCQTVNVIGLGLGSDTDLTYLEVYPNPTNGILSVKGISSQTTYKIHSSLGNQVQEGIMTSPGDINLKDLKPGCYLIDFQNGKGSIARIRVILR